MTLRTIIAIFLLTLLVACERGGASPTSQPAAPTTEATPSAPPASATTGISPTSAPSATTVASATIEPATTAAPTAPADASAPYLDDRSSPATLLASFVSALNRKEYARAYGYWEEGAVGLAPFDDFAAGYVDTESVALDLGPISGDAGMSQRFYAVPVAYTVQSAGDGEQFFAGCYVLHLTIPDVQEPPVRPLAIRQGQFAEVASIAEALSARESACDDLAPGSPPIPDESFAPDDLSAARYLDDRTDAVTLMRSFVNALNRREYSRAYSYWRPDAAGLALFEDFAAGYAATESVALLTGAARADAGAGQRYYALPVIMTATQSGGTTERFVGCYVMHISEPSFQTEPPFRPMAIHSATVQGLPEGSDPATALATACP